MTIRYRINKGLGSASVTYEEPAEKGQILALAVGNMEFSHNEASMSFGLSEISSFPSRSQEPKHYSLDELINALNDLGAIRETHLERQDLSDDGVKIGPKR